MSGTYIYDRAIRYLKSRDPEEKRDLLSRVAQEAVTFSSKGRDILGRYEWAGFCRMEDRKFLKFEGYGPEMFDGIIVAGINIYLSVRGMAGTYLCIPYDYYYDPDLFWKDLKEDLDSLYGPGPE